MTRAAKYDKPVQMQLRIPQNLKAWLETQAGTGKVNETIVRWIEERRAGVTTTLDQPETITADMADITIVQEMTREDALTRWPELTIPDFDFDRVFDHVRAGLLASSPWYGQLDILKALPKLQQGRIFSALVRESSGGALQLPEGFRDMTQADKASWLDKNCPLGGA